MTARRLCLTATDRSGATPDEEAWVTVDAFSHFDAYATTCRAFIDYLHGRGIRVGAWHVGTDDWVRDYPKKYGV